MGGQDGQNSPNFCCTGSHWKLVILVFFFDQKTNRTPKSLFMSLVFMLGWLLPARFSDQNLGSYAKRGAIENLVFKTYYQGIQRFIWSCSLESCHELRCALLRLCVRVLCALSLLLQSHSVLVLPCSALLLVAGVPSVLC